MLEMEAIVKGQVQGVGFRARVFHFASQLGVKGFVKNCADGSVEIRAQGPKEKLEKLIQELQQHPGLGAISSIETHFWPVTKAYEDFSIF